MSDTSSTKYNYKKGLGQRHLLFIALGSAIGTGLFMGSAETINLAGPSVLLAYLISGFMIFLVMRSLGEMVLQNPAAGSFGHYANNHIGKIAGFLTGWTYILEMALVCIADVTAFAIYMHLWYPDVPAWVWTLGISLILTAINLTAVKLYGELEFILSGIKIVAIVAMIIGGAVILILAMYHGSNNDIGIHNLWSHGGWFPNGLQGFIYSFVIVAFAFGGIEIIGLAAPESKNVERDIPRAINSLPIRIILFYCLTLAVLMSIYPWNKVGLDESPFVSIFTNLGITSAANILNVVVIIASISAINSDIYGAARMMQGLAKEGQAVKHLTFIGKNGVPIFSVLLMFVVLVVGVVLNYFFHEGLFFLVAAMVTFATVFVWLMIVLSQIMMRLKLPKSERDKLLFPVPFWPIGPIVSFLFMIFIIVLIGVMPDSRPALICGAIWIVWLIVCFYAIKIFNKKGKVFLLKD